MTQSMEIEGDGHAGRVEPGARAGSGDGCCGPAEQASCCEPSAKAACCGDAAGAECGCN